MIILKHGNLKKRKFLCQVCGCEFVANQNECYQITARRQILWYEATCPDCNADTNTSEPWEENDG